MNSIYYLLEANAYLIVFYIFYKLMLQRETFYSLNRFYILITVLLSFLLPFLDMSTLRPVEEIIYAAPDTVIPEENLDQSIWSLLQECYLLVVFILLGRLALRVYGIACLLRTGEVIKRNGFKEVQIRDKNISFSFLSYLFINPELRDQDTILKHEQVHINQKHSLDILFIEIIQIVNWFNPVISFMRTDIKALHEFIADEVVSKEELGVEKYARFLILNSYGAIQYNLSNQMFNQSLLKKRIMKLGQKKSSNSSMMKYAFLTLLIPSMLCISAFSISKTYGIMDILPAPQENQDTAKVKSEKSTPRHNVTQKKFAPPVIIHNNTTGRQIPPPLVEHPKAKSFPKPKVKNIKFPPPVIVPIDSKKKSNIVETGQTSELREMSIDKSTNEVLIEEPVATEVRVKTPTIVKPPRPKIYPKPVLIENNNKQIPRPTVELSATKSIPHPKVGEVKFPKPVLLKNNSNKRIPPPPPPVEPKTKTIKGTPIEGKRNAETIKNGTPKNSKVVSTRLNGVNYSPVEKTTTFKNPSIEHKEPGDMGSIAYSKAENSKVTKIRINHATFIPVTKSIKPANVDPLEKALLKEVESKLKNAVE